jgi:tripartite-type tricarboxylate transporter receptor subunit TctC
MPSPLVAWINREINRLLAAREVADRFANQGAEVLAGSSEDFARILAADVARWGKIVRETGATVD